MKRVYTLKGLDCPNCSAKIEKEVGELDGVHSSSVNLKATKPVFREISGIQAYLYALVHKYPLRQRRG